MTEHLESVAKIGLYAALLLVVGSHAAGGLLRIGGRLEREDADVERRIARVGLRAGAALIVFLLFRLWAHTAASFGVAEASSSWDNVSLIAFESRWGVSWRLQIAGAVVSLLASAWAIGSPGRWSRRLAAVTAVALVCTFPLTGHAAGDRARTVVDVLHLLAGSAWLGTLAVLLVARPRRSLFARFSPLALSGAGVAVLTGLVMTWLYLGTVANLVTTTYGRWLAAKLAVVLAVAGCGYVNWQRTKAGEPPALARLEIVLAFLIVVITAFLTETAHP